MKNRHNLLFKIITISIIFYGFILFFFGLPFPRGKRICSDYSTYYENWIKEESTIYPLSMYGMINFGHWGYLKDVSKETFIILDDNWAKDKKHVWYQDKIIETADAVSFRRG